MDKSEILFRRILIVIVTVSIGIWLSYISPTGSIVGIVGLCLFFLGIVYMLTIEGI